MIYTRLRQKSTNHKFITIFCQKYCAQVGVWDPWIVVSKGPRVWYRVVREIVTIERMHRAFARGLMEYGMVRAAKTAAA